MNWKLFLGKTAASLQNRVTQSGSAFVYRHFPYGRDWIFDLKRILPDPEIMIDAGAHTGSVTAGLHTHFPQAKIYAFEPVSANFDRLAECFRGHDNIHLESLALGDTHATLPVALAEDDTTHTLKHRASATNRQTEHVRVIRLEDFLRERSVGRVDLLNIDVEGYELDVLRGCEGLFTAHGIKSILVEAGYERVPTKVHFTDIENLMERRDFRLCGIYDLQRNLHDKRRLWFANHLYIHTSLLQT